MNDQEMNINNEIDEDEIYDEELELENEIADYLFEIQMAYKSVLYYK